MEGYDDVSSMHNWIESGPATQDGACYRHHSTESDSLAQDVSLGISQIKVARRQRTM
jgi:hypothetical protein